MISSKLKINKDPIVKLIEKIIRSWVINKCNSIESIRFDIKGTVFDLIRGNIPTVILYAKSVDFQSIKLSSIEIRSDSIYINFNKNTKKIDFRKNFKIHIVASLKAEGLNDSLSSERWLSIKQLIEKECLNQSLIRNIIFDKGKLVLSHISNELGIIIRENFSINAEYGTLTLVRDSDNFEFSLPMDPAIRIMDAKIIGNKLQLIGYSSVNS